MITVEKYPAKVSLIGNPIEWMISTDNYYSTVGTHAAPALQIVDGVVANNSFKLTFAGIELVFVCKANPDSSGVQFRPKALGESEVSYYNYMLSMFDSNYNLSKYYDMGIFFGNIIFVAKEKGTKYNMTCTSNTTPFIFTANNGTNPVVRDHYKILFQTFAYKNNGYKEKLSEDLIPVSSNLKASINIQDKFSTTFSDMSEMFEMDFALLSSNYVTKRKLCRKIEVKIAEFYGSDPTPTLLNVITDYYIMPGKLPEWKHILLANSGSSWWNDYLYFSDFLTFSPSSEDKITDIDTQEFLYFLCPKSKTFNIKCIYKDIDNEEHTKTLYSLGCDIYDVLEINCGLALIANHGEDVVSYRVWVEDIDGLNYSPARYFLVDKTEYEQKKILYFRNSYGVMETLRCTGLSETMNTYERLTAEVLYSPAVASNFRSKKNYDITSSEKIKTNTGFISKNYVDYLQELFLSNEVYELTGTSLMPIVITNSDFFRRKDGNLLYNATIEYERINASAAFVPISENVNKGDYSEDFNYDFN